MLRNKFWLVISGVLMAAYTGYVVWAKLATVVGTIPLRLSETAEFLLFLSSVVALALQVFVEDARRGETEDAHPGHDA